MLPNNLLALGITFICAILWLRANDFAAHRGWISSSVSRKLIHIGTGPIFVACWLLFKNTAAARYLAALVPLTITAQFILVGTGILHDQAAVQAMSRTGDRREILHGPLYYGLVFVTITAFYWYDSPVGIVALMLMCGGDGLADIIGRKYGKKHLPWNRTKSWAGSLAMFLGGWVFSLAILALYHTFGVFTSPLALYLLPLAAIGLVATLIESLPIRDIDNLTITLGALVTGYLLLP